MRKCGDRRIAEVAQLGVHLARRFGVRVARASLNRGGVTAKPPIIRTRRIAEEACARWYGERGGAGRFRDPVMTRGGGSQRNARLVCGWHEERIDQRRGLLTERTGGQRRVS